MLNRGRASSMPEQHLGLGTMLPSPPPPPSSIKDSSSGSITGKMNVREVGVSASSSSAGQNENPNVIAGDTQNQEEGQRTLGTEEIIPLEDGDPEEDEVVTGKRKKRCTSVVWQYFTKKTVVVEVERKKYEQLWGYCNFPKCRQRYRAESTNGTNAFRSHLKSSHSIVKGQLQLNAEKGRGKDVNNFQPFSSHPIVSVPFLEYYKQDKAGQAVDDSEVIGFLLQTEIIPVCLPSCLPNALKDGTLNNFLQNQLREHIL